MNGNHSKLIAHILPRNAASNSWTFASTWLVIWTTVFLDYPYDTVLYSSFPYPWDPNLLCWVLSREGQSSFHPPHLEGKVYISKNSAHIIWAWFLEWVKFGEAQWRWDTIMFSIQSCHFLQWNWSLQVNCNSGRTPGHTLKLVTSILVPLSFDSALYVCCICCRSIKAFKEFFF